MSATAAPAGPQTAQQKPKRPICQGCNFPERTCICPSLPSEPLSSLFHRCRIVVLQHPHELRRKNRSLPLVELCLFGKGQTQVSAVEEVGEKTQQSNALEDTPTDEDFVMKTVVSRRFGDHCDGAVMKILRDPNEVVVLVFPHKDALGLEEGLRLAEERCAYVDTTCDIQSGEDGKLEAAKEGTAVSKESAKELAAADPKKKMTLVFIDATWKHAREMETRTADAGEWPKNLIRVQMAPSTTVGGNKNDDGDAGPQITVDNTKEGAALPTFIERRFHIQTPPSPDHLSTAECLAWIASRVERNPAIYQSVMKALDYMVGQWQSFTADNRGGKVRGFTDGDGCWDAMSQKKRKIKPNI